MHKYAENEPAMKKNEAALNNLPGEIYTIKANNKIPDNCKQPPALIQAPQNQKHINTEGLVKLLKLKIGLKVMLKVNIDIQNGLINGQTGNINHIEFAQGSVCICKVFR